MTDPTQNDSGLPGFFKTREVKTLRGQCLKLGCS
jgi:hypothetical protein